MFSRIRLLSVYLFTLFLMVYGAAPLYAQKSLTLQQSLAIAEKNSPDIRRVMLNLERSSQSLKAQQAALKSRFSLSITPLDYSKDRRFNTDFSSWFTTETKQSYGMFTIAQPITWTDGTFAIINRLSWRDANSSNPFGTSNSRTYDNNLYLSFQQPIFTYNRTKINLRSLELDLENNSLSYDIEKLALEKMVTQNFYDVYKQKMSKNIAIEERNNQQKSYEIIKNKVNAGLAAKEELYQAELNLATSESQLQNENVALENARDGFKNLIGISLFDSIQVTADISHHPVKVDLNNAIEHGLKYRMELRQRKIDIENAQFNLIQTSALNEFKGNISLNYGIIGTDEQFGNIYDVPTKNQRFSISFDIPLWDWGEKKSRIKASQAVVKNRQLSLEDERNSIIIGIRQAYRSLINLENQVEIARQNVRNAQLTYDINLERYKNGDLTSMDLNLFQTQLSQKKMGLVEALINYKLALLNLKIQSLWDFERDKSVISIDK